MLTIGGFAALSGLTLQALRHYDEVGLLSPADVDPSSGYRRYAASQLGEAATIATLRAMGLAIPDIKDVLAAPETLHQRVDEFEARRQEDREREDRVMAEGRLLLDGFHHQRPVQARACPAQPWVGYLTRLALDADEHAIEESNGEFDAFVHELNDSGLGPKPWWWLDVRQINDDSIVAAWCVPVDDNVTSSLRTLDVDVDSGVLPARTEWYVPVDEPTPMSGEIRAPHPGLVSLIMGLGDDMSAVRHLYYPEGENIRMEIVADAPQGSTDV
ncbi:MAG: MerR family transcriptional regulator [Brachybacterium sp.]|nr:MerR family transcriptional regulator [Brachybacterium sp.]